MILFSILLIYIIILIISSLINYERFSINKKCFNKLNEMIFIKFDDLILGYNRNSEYSYIFSNFLLLNGNFRIEIKKYEGIYFNKYDIFLLPYNFYYYIKINNYIKKQTFYEFEFIPEKELNFMVKGLFLQKEREEKLKNILNL